MSDPRVYFAAERTLLAWVRSGLTIIAMGFVIARFGLFLTLLPAVAAMPVAEGANHWLSEALGVALVIIGATAILGAVYNHRRYVASLPPADLPGLALPGLAVWLSWLIALAGFLLAFYLAVV
jgi:putative membrane protein